MIHKIKVLGQQNLVFKFLIRIPIVGIFEKRNNMAKNTSILLGDYYENFISSQIQSGRFTSASEVVRTALRQFEEEENLKKEINKELEKGEKSGFVKSFDRTKFINSLHKKYLVNEL